MGRKKKSNKNQAVETGNIDVHQNTEESATSSDGEANGTELYTVESSSVYGRYLKTKKDVAKGTLLLAEKFLVAGPMRSSDIVCVGCQSDLKGSKTVCPRCSWPICKRKCADSIFHAEECKFFVDKQVKAWLNFSVPLNFLQIVITCDMHGVHSWSLLLEIQKDQFPKNISTTEFGAVTILRALIMKYQNQEGWKKLMNLEHHNEIRKMLPLWRENELSVVEVIFELLKLDSFFTTEEVHTVCGIFEVNAFELGEKYSFRGIFPEAAMMAHDCIPNTTHFENPVDGIIEVRAAVDIAAGTPITVCYAYALESTSQRRKMLLETKFFECVCKRCNDPRELSTNMGTLICQSCRSGNSGNIINTGAEEIAQIWACDKCESRIPLAGLEGMIEKWQMLVEQLGDIKSQEKALSTCKSNFHATHFVPFGIKFNLCQAYGREDVPLMELSQSDLERKLELCREVMEILDVITPGYTITRGLVLYELQAAEIVQARRLFEMRRISKTLLKRKLQNTLKTLKESIAILELSHSSTSEYQMAKAAEKETVVDITRWISSLK